VYGFLLVFLSDVTLSLKRTVFEIFYFFLYSDLETWVRGHLRSISHRFRDTRQYPLKIANFSHPRVLNAPMKGFPLEFSIGLRGPECFYNGATRRSKKFSDRFSRFDTIPAVTDSQPPSRVVYS